MDLLDVRSRASLIICIINLAGIWSGELEIMVEAELGMCVMPRLIFCDMQNATLPFYWSMVFIRFFLETVDKLEVGQDNL